MADEAEKTEPATPKKKEDARRKGQVAQSRDVSTVMLLVAGTLALSSPLAETLAGTVFDNARRMWGGLLIRPASIPDFHAIFMDTALLVIAALVPFATPVFS